MINMRPIGKSNLLFRRTTNRYAKKGTISNNTGYLCVARDTSTGKFVTRHENQKDSFFNWLFGL